MVLTQLCVCVCVFVCKANVMHLNRAGTVGPQTGPRKSQGRKARTDGLPAARVNGAGLISICCPYPGRYVCVCYAR